VVDLDVVRSVSGAAAHDRTISVFRDIPGEVASKRFGDAALVKALNIKTMVSIPVLNSYNINQPEVLINIFCCDKPQFDRGLLMDLACHVAIAVERAWRDMHALVLEEIHHAASGCGTVRELLETIVERVRVYTGCIGTSLFLVDDAGARLKLAATTGLAGVKDPSSVSYGKGEGLPGTVWQTNEFLTSGAPARCEADDPHPKEDVGAGRHSVMVAPIRNAVGDVMGVIRCRGKGHDSPGISSSFSVSDEIVLTALRSAVSPHLERLMTTERRSRAMTRITHELRVPITVTLGAVEFMREELKELRRKHGWRFAEDYLGDIQGYMELMSGLVGKAAFLRPEITVNISQPSRLYADIIVPAVRQVRVLLEERHFRPERIDCSGMKDVPTLRVDKPRFQQVFFNLLSNSIKYAYTDPTAFRVEIAWESFRDAVHIFFRDWGPGIDEGYEDAIFREGVRGPEAYQSHVAGDGFGCYLVRQILRAHGGDIRLTSRKLPTEFTLAIPSQLVGPMRQKRKEPK
jgi:signal transduction histidine kinase